MPSFFDAREASGLPRQGPRVAALLAFVALAGAVVAILRHARLASAPGRFADFDGTPGLVITEFDVHAKEAGRTTDGKSVSAREHDERAASLAFASAAPEDRQRVIDAVNYAAARLEARLLPIGTDFDEGDPVGQLRTTLTSYATTFNAAHALERGRWQSDDLAVRPVASCERASLRAGERCVPLWPRDGDAGVRHSVDGRARFLAWPAANAVVFEVSSEAAKSEVLVALRRRARVAESSVALALETSDLALRPVSEHAALEQAAERLGTALAASDRAVDEQLQALASRPLERPIVPWLALSERAIVVVPRLSAIHRRAELLAEVEAAVAGQQARWIHHR